jgi:hypothetical protein
MASMSLLSCAGNRGSSINTAGSDGTNLLLPRLNASRNEAIAQNYAAPVQYAMVLRARDNMFPSDIGLVAHNQG